MAELYTIPDASVHHPLRPCRNAVLFDISTAYMVAVTQMGAMKIAVTAIAQPGTPMGRRMAQTVKSDVV